MLLLAACSSPSDQLRKTFNTVNNSLLRASYAASQQKYQAYYHLVQDQRDTNALVAAKADSLYSVTEKALKYMEQLKLQLSAMDSVGDKTRPAEQLLLHTLTSDSLRTDLLDVSRYAYDGLIGKEKITSLDSELQGIHTITGQKDWTGMYFRRASTEWTLALLSITQINCLHAATITFSSMAHVKTPVF